MHKQQSVVGCFKGYVYFFLYFFKVDVFSRYVYFFKVSIKLLAGREGDKTYPLETCCA